jgi:hypothetical protein
MYVYVYTYIHIYTHTHAKICIIYAENLPPTDCGDRDTDADANCRAGSRPEAIRLLPVPFPKKKQSGGSRLCAHTHACLHARECAFTSTSCIYVCVCA